MAQRFDRMSLFQDDHNNELNLDAELIVRLAAECGCATQSTSAHSLRTVSYIGKASATAFASAGSRGRGAIPKLQDLESAQAAHRSGIRGGSLDAEAASGLYHARATAPC
jgi:hypothetical protein